MKIIFLLSICFLVYFNSYSQLIIEKIKITNLDIAKKRVLNYDKEEFINNLNTIIDANDSTRLGYVLCLIKLDSSGLKVSEIKCKASLTDSLSLMKIKGYLMNLTEFNNVFENEKGEKEKIEEFKISLIAKKEKRGNYRFVEFYTR